jgi:hypothetical protein
VTTDEKLAAILAAVQTDPGNRGLARDPHDNLFTATKGDFEAACRGIVAEPSALMYVYTGFIIPSADPPTFETDGPLGAVFLARALRPRPFSLSPQVIAEPACAKAVFAGLQHAGEKRYKLTEINFGSMAPDPWRMKWTGWVLHEGGRPKNKASHMIAIERAGPARDDRCYTMRGKDTTDLLHPNHLWFDWSNRFGRTGGGTMIGIGDGGNEVGMGKIPHETIVKNIPNGKRIHCRVPTDRLIVAGVSNWGAYALAAGVYVLRGVKPPADLFDPNREREILEVMVREGPLVDGVTGKQTATVDGLSWGEYSAPLIRIREILES